MDKTLNNSMNNAMNSAAYWDTQGLSKLKMLSSGDQAAQREAAKQAAVQFEALLLNEMLKAARSSDMSEDNPMNSSAAKHFQAMFDQQVAHTMAGKGMGFAQHIEKMILASQASRD
jgi:peptidoglycan hydrolase FlgJ